MQLAVRALKQEKRRTVHIRAIADRRRRYPGNGAVTFIDYCQSHRANIRGAAGLFDLGQRPGDFAMRARPESRRNVPQRRFG